VQQAAGRRSIVALVVGVALAGCIHSGFTPTTGLELPPRPEGCYLDLIFQGPPPYAYVVIGQVHTESTAPGVFALGENNEVAVERLKAEACRQGAHGIMQVGAASQGIYTRQGGYSKSTSGDAVAFIYVDSTGRPLPPPTAPHVVIQPGAYSNPAAPTASTPGAGQPYVGTAPTPPPPAPPAAEAEPFTAPEP
jgi:hypothetical protein